MIRLLGHAALAARISSARPRLGRTRLVCLDGPAGSGKTSLADRLADLLADRSADRTATVLHLDDVYRGWGTDFGEVHGRLHRQVFQPLAAGRAGCYQRFDWHADAFTDWVELPVPDVLLLEGVGAGARRLDRWRSLLVWIELGPDERLRRGLDRDGPAAVEHWRGWMEREQAEFAAQQTRERADLRLWGSSPPGFVRLVD